jgi:hypothetical protein
LPRKGISFGIQEAKRRLGIITLKDARGIEQMEKGFIALVRSSINGDLISNSIIKTLVLDVQGREEDADSGIAEVQQIAPLLGNQAALG